LHCEGGDPSLRDQRRGGVQDRFDPPLTTRLLRPTRLTSVVRNVFAPLSRPPRRYDLPSTRALPRFSRSYVAAAETIPG
jgi:hypothetical protein